MLRCFRAYFLWQGRCCFAWLAFHVCRSVLSTSDSTSFLNEGSLWFKLVQTTADWDGYNEVLQNRAATGRAVADKMQGFEGPVLTVENLTATLQLKDTLLKDSPVTLDSMIVEVPAVARDVHMEQVADVQGSIPFTKLQLIADSKASSSRAHYAMYIDDLSPAADEIRNMSGGVVRVSGNSSSTLQLPVTLVFDVRLCLTLNSSNSTSCYPAQSYNTTNMGELQDLAPMDDAAGKVIQAALDSMGFSGSMAGLNTLHLRGVVQIAGLPRPPLRLISQKTGVISLMQEDVLPSWEILSSFVSPALNSSASSAPENVNVLMTDEWMEILELAWAVMQEDEDEYVGIGNNGSGNNSFVDGNLGGGGDPATAVSDAAKGDDHGSGGALRTGLALGLTLLTVLLLLVALGTYVYTRRRATITSTVVRLKGLCQPSSGSSTSKQPIIPRCPEMDEGKDGFHFRIPAYVPEVPDVNGLPLASNGSMAEGQRRWREGEGTTSAQDVGTSSLGEGLQQATSNEGNLFPLQLSGSLDTELSGHLENPRLRAG